MSFIGSGSYATGVLIPAFKEAGARLHSVASSAGVSGLHAARKFGFEETTTDTDRLLVDAEANAVVITTRHDSRAQFVIKALNAGKPVFVEKPLVLRRAELDEVTQVVADRAGQGQAPLFMVGFNRRFSPLVQKAKSLLDNIRTPKVFIMTVNAGAIPAEHWTQAQDIGGGRIGGEACHFVELFRFLAGCRITGVQVTEMGPAPGLQVRDDKTSFTLSFEDGSFGTVHYLANGHKSFPKERLEIFAGGGILQLDNFRILKGFGWPGFKNMRPSVALNLKRDAVRELANRFRVTNPRVFGSVLRGVDEDGRDLDLIVEPLPDATLFDLGGLQVELEDLLGVHVDLLTPGDLPPHYRKQVLKEARPI